MSGTSEKFDVVVVGAGTGGSIAARFAAEKGLSVCLIDSKEKARIGNKICGDAVGSEIFDFLRINHPKGDELACHIKGVKLYSPDLQKCLTLIDPKHAGYMVNRIEFGQRLVNDALDAGVKQFLDNTMALNLIYQGDLVAGIKVRARHERVSELRSKILIDASGYYSPLRPQVKNPNIEKQLSKGDSIICFREIVRFPKKDQVVKDPDYLTIIMDQYRAPGGYVWYFPKDEYSVNMGLGVMMDYKGKVKELYRKNVFDQFVKTSSYTIESSGGGVVSVRRPLWSCVENGLMLVGDSGYQVNPLNGGGIDPSMRAGFYAAKAAVKAIKAGDYSLKKLWTFNRGIMTTFGAQFSALEMLRMVLQVLTNEELNFGLSKDLLSDREIANIVETGHIDLSILDMVTKAVKGLGNPKLLLDLNYLRIRMNEVSTVYRNFPEEIDQFAEWKKQAAHIYDKISKKVINPRNHSRL